MCPPRLVQNPAHDVTKMHRLCLRQQAKWLPHLAAVLQLLGAGGALQGIKTPVYDLLLDACGRRNGKPTSLGCFDHEEQAARAYDKMMLWCELHNTSGVKGGITNFDPTEYEKDLHQLSSVTQARMLSLSSLSSTAQQAYFWPFFGLLVASPSKSSGDRLVWVMVCPCTACCHMGLLCCRSDCGDISWEPASKTFATGR